MYVQKRCDCSRLRLLLMSLSIKCLDKDRQLRLAQKSTTEDANLRQYSSSSLVSWSEIICERSEKRCGGTSKLNNNTLAKQLAIKFSRSVLLLLAAPA